MILPPVPQQSVRLLRPLSLLPPLSGAWTRAGELRRRSSSASRGVSGSPFPLILISTKKHTGVTDEQWTFERRWRRSSDVLYYLYALGGGDHLSAARGEAW